MQKFSTSILILTLMLPVAGIAAPALQWEHTELRVNAGPYEKEVTAVFPFVNTSDKPVTIKWLKSVCGCLTARARDVMIPPGGKDIIMAKFALEHRFGLQRRPIHVLTDDPEQPKTILYLYVDIPRVLQPEKSVLRWLGNESMDKKTLKITTLPEYPVQELRARPGREGLMVNVVKVGPDSFELQVHPSLRGFSGSVKLEADLGSGVVKSQDVFVRVD